MWQGKLLRHVRILLSSVIFILLSVYVATAGSGSVKVAHWLVKCQIIPAILSFALTIVIVWLLVTLVFGRIYCSSICPLGTFQDISSRIFRKSPVLKPFRYVPAADKTRFVTLGAVFILILTGFVNLALCFDPWTVFRLFGYSYIYTALRISEAGGSIGAISGDVNTVTGISFIAALLTSGLTMLAVAVSSARHGRKVCNTVCPVGTMLGFISRYSILHIDIDTDLCTNCRKCVDVCKAQCIELNAHVVDGSRCVNCFNCVAICPNAAIRYTWQRHQLAFPLLQRTDASALGCSSQNTTTDQ